MRKLLAVVAALLVWFAPTVSARAQVVVVRPWIYHPYVYRPWLVPPVAPVVPVYRPYAYYHPYGFRRWGYRPAYRRW
jgi:hypothetical protein